MCDYSLERIASPRIATVRKERARGLCPKLFWFRPFVGF